MHSIIIDFLASIFFRERENVIGSVNIRKNVLLYVCVTWHSAMHLKLDLLRNSSEI
jgi:hypothetical protein